MSEINIKEFRRSINPSQTIDFKKPEDRVYYIDFASVRGVEIIQDLKREISFDEDRVTCTLFTGHIGCGKSTELLRLRKELEDDDFHVVYFDSSDRLERADVDIADVLLVIARCIAQDLEANEITLQPTGLEKLLKDVGEILNAEVTGFKFNSPLGPVGGSAEKEKFSLSVGIGEVTAKTKSDSRLRQQMNQYVGPKKSELLKNINEELITPAIAQLKQRGKKGLVVIVDNLEKIENTVKTWGTPQQEYLFVDQADSLTKFSCHFVYTMPLALRFSNRYGELKNSWARIAKVLPMVPVKMRNNEINQPGLNLLKQMVLTRACPHLQEESDRLNKIQDIFENEMTLNKLCLMSGGHVRELLIFLDEWIGYEQSFPLTDAQLTKVLRNHRNEMTMCISKAEKKLLQEVRENKEVNHEEGYEKLIRSRWVFEYRDERGSWYDVNPILNPE